MRRPFLIGLTGSIGMGKTTTASMFAKLGVPIWNADAAVHRLYSKGGAAVGPIGQICPEAVQDEQVMREVLKAWIASDPSALAQIEAVVHPRVAQDREAFVESVCADCVLLDIPLLFETGGDAHVDAVVVASAPADVQRDRVLARPGMTQSHFETILAKQTPDSEKRARADYVIETVSMKDARAQVQACLVDVKERIAYARNSARH